MRPLLGRTFLVEEEDPGRDRVVVLSYGLWKRRYGADRALVGKAIPIDGQDHTVVGVMPPHFQFQFWGGPRELWVPAGWTRGDREGRGNLFVSIGRLKTRSRRGLMNLTAHLRSVTTPPGVLVQARGQGVLWRPWMQVPKDQ